MDNLVVRVVYGYNPHYYSSIINRNGGTVIVVADPPYCMKEGGHLAEEMMT